MRTPRSEQRGRPMPAQYRQGDVLLCRVSKVHSGSPVPPDAGGRLVIAEGEHSGHAHALAPERAQLFRRGRQLRLSVGADGTALSHEEHSPILLPQGHYLIRRQREYWKGLNVSVAAVDSRIRSARKTIGDRGIGLRLRL